MSERGTKRDELVIRRRNKLRHHTTVVSNVILRGYHHVSDHAKLTYLVIDSYDWPDEDGLSKGSAWPAIGTIAAERGKSYTSIWRDIKELVAAGLLTVESGQRRGTTNVYWIEDPSPAEFERYLARRRGVANLQDPTPPLSHLQDPALTPSQDPPLADSQDKESNANQAKPNRMAGCAGWDPQSLWETLVAEARPAPADRHWLAGAHLRGLTDDTLEAVALTTFAAEWLQQRLAPRLEAAARRLLNRPVRLHVTVGAVSGEPP